MRVLVCGSRAYAERAFCFRALDALHREHGFSELLAGGATGADTLAVDWAKLRDVPFTEYPVTPDDWRRLGRKAGPLRNARMLKEGRPALVVAFPGHGGTADMVRQARRASVPVVDGEILLAYGLRGLGKEAP